MSLRTEYIVRRKPLGHLVKAAAGKGKAAALILTA